MRSRFTPMEKLLDELELRGVKIPIETTSFFLLMEEESIIAAYDEGKKDGILDDEDVHLYWGEEYYTDTYGE